MNSTILGAIMGATIRSNKNNNSSITRNWKYECDNSCPKYCDPHHFFKKVDFSARELGFSDSTCVHAASSIVTKRWLLDHLVKILNYQKPIECFEKVGDYVTVDIQARCLVVIVPFKHRSCWNEAHWPRFRIHFNHHQSQQIFLQGINKVRY